MLFPAHCKKTALKVDAKIKISISSKYVKFWFLLAPFPKKRKKDLLNNQTYSFIYKNSYFILKKKGLKEPKF
jgi:hypothetical protein